MNKMKKIGLGIMFVVFIQIFLLIGFSFAESKIIADSSQDTPTQSLTEKKDKLFDFSLKGIKLLVSFFSISQIGTVSAATECCEKVVNGGWCLNEENTLCDLGFQTSGTNCANTVFCEPGYCYDPNQGFCSEGSSRSLCERGPDGQRGNSDDGVWTRNFNAAKCQKGCCNLGVNTQYVEEKRCEVLSNYQGVPLDWNPETPENVCKFYTGERGACVGYDEESCTITTERICDQSSGRFYEGRLCSDPTLETNCIGQYRIGCDDQLYEVYWYDSCGNRENIYDYSKRNDPVYKSRIMNKEDLCDPNDPNINDRSCGNCGYDYQSFCGVASSTHIQDYQKGDFICKSRNCDSVNRVNDESWCLYDAYVGNKTSGQKSGGRDLPGSSYYRQYCSNGEVETELCGTTGLREEICAEKIVDGVSTAQCRINLGAMCFGIENYDECWDAPDCMWKSVDLTGEHEKDNFEFGFCVPKYPQGFDLNSEDSFRSGEDLCEAMGEVKCTSIWQKGWDFKYSCKVNCRCDDKDFVYQMNDMCSSLGDCGVSINLAGEVSGNLPLGGRYTRPTTTDWKNYYKNLLDKTKNKVEDNTPYHLLINDNPRGYEELNMEGIDPGDLDRWDSVYPLRIFGSDFDVILPLNLVPWIFGSIFGIGKTKKKETIFTCKPWGPPVGGDDCYRCNSDPNKICTEYRCLALGTACRLDTNVYGEESPQCYDAYEQDNIPPTVTFSEFKPGTKTESGGAFNIRPPGGGNCFINFTKVNITLTTTEGNAPEGAACKWDYENKPYDEMENYLRENGRFVTTHMLENFPLTGSSNTNSIFIRCIDRKGNKKAEALRINYCIDPTPDTLPPKIEGFNPPSNSYVAYGVENTTFSAILDAPVDGCRFDYSTGVAYENMTQEMLCSDPDSIPWEFNCDGLIEGISGTKTIYIKCNDSSGNINVYDEEYTVRQTQNPLLIETIVPANNTLIDERITQENPFTLGVRTKGGAFGGKTNCRFRFVEAGWNDFFSEENSTRHEYSFTNLREGNNTIKIDCSDAAGNNVVDYLYLVVDIDTEKPNVVRAFHAGSFLRIITDEDAQCYANTNTNTACNFDMNTTTIIEYGNDTVHNLNWDPDKTFFIQCIDKYGNGADDFGCELIVRASEMI